MVKPQTLLPVCLIHYYYHWCAHPENFSLYLEAMTASFRSTSSLPLLLPFPVLRYHHVYPHQYSSRQEGMRQVCILLVIIVVVVCFVAVTLTVAYGFDLHSSFFTNCSYTTPQLSSTKSKVHWRGHQSMQELRLCRSRLYLQCNPTKKRPQGQ